MKPVNARRIALNFNFVKKYTLYNDVVFLDGMGISGKHMLAPILSTYNRVEIGRADAIFEHIANLFYFGHITLEGAVTIMRYALDEDLYDSMIGRNTNFRVSDASSVFHAMNFRRYAQRALSIEEGEAIVRRIRREKPVFQNLTHEILGFSEPCFAAFGDSLRMVELVRHPINLVERWLNSGWGENRYHGDPRSFVLAVARGRHVGAYFSRDVLEEYGKMAPIDRVIHDIHSVWTRIMDGFESLSSQNKRQVLFVRFEDLVTEPYAQLERIERFIGLTRGPHLERVLAEQRCPRVLSLTDRAKLGKSLARRASVASRKLLRSLIIEYEDTELGKGSAV